jgi:hypothetical protein
MARPGDAPAWVHALLAACGGFLLSTLWFDLMFDVQVLWGWPLPLPEPIVASIAAYYRRVTTDARPMQQLVGVVMVVAVIGSIWAARYGRHRLLRWAGLGTCAAPIALAMGRVFPNAVLLGQRSIPLADQSTLARSIFVDHVICLACIVGFVCIQVVLSRVASPTD